MDTSKYRGRSPENTSGLTCRISDKDLKKIKVKIVNTVSNVESSNRNDRNLDTFDKLTIVRGKSEGTKPIFERAGIFVNKDTDDDNIDESAQGPKSPRRHNSRSDYFSHSSRSVDPSPRKDNRSSHRETSRIQSRSPRRHSRNREHSRSRDRRSRSKDKRSRSKDRRSISRERNSRTRDGRSRDRRSKSRERRSRSRERRSRTRERRSRSREKRSRSRNRRSRSRHRSLSPRRRYEDRIRRHDRREYDHRNSRERRILHSRSRRRSRSRSRSRGRYPQPALPEHLDHNAIGALPIIVPPDIHFYGADEIWFPPPLRPPVFLPRGLLPPRNYYRHPMYRPPMQRAPFFPMSPRGPALPVRTPIIRPRPPRES